MARVERQLLPLLRRLVSTSGQQQPLHTTTHNAFSAAGAAATQQAGAPALDAVAGLKKRLAAGACLVVVCLRVVDARVRGNCSQRCAQSHLPSHTLANTHKKNNTKQ